MQVICWWNILVNMSGDILTIQLTPLCGCPKTIKTVEMSFTVTRADINTHSFILS